MPDQEGIVVYECRECFALLPYGECSHRCPCKQLDYADKLEEFAMVCFVEIIKKAQDFGLSLTVVEC
jgi:hypothetical protein